MNMMLTSIRGEREGSRGGSGEGDMKEETNERD